MYNMQDARYPIPARQQVSRPNVQPNPMQAAPMRPAPYRPFQKYEGLSQFPQTLPQFGGRPPGVRDGMGRTPAPSPMNPALSGMRTSPVADRILGKYGMMGRFGG